MKGIFISYRRQDAAGYAGRLYDRLAAHFGADRVFMDVEGIEPGLDFVDAIGRAVSSCEVLIVIIGPAWLATDSAGKRRLDDPKDFVRIETKAALARHIRVVPVLVDGAVMPREEDLPRDLAPLVRRQAVELSHKYWDATSAELIRTLERVLDGDKASDRQKTPATSTPTTESDDATLLVVRTRHVRRFWVIGGAVALAAAAVGLYVAGPWREPEVAGGEKAAGSVPPKVVAAQSPETTAPPDKPPVAQVVPPSAPAKPAEPPAEKLAPPAKEKAPAPSESKAVPRPEEKTTTTKTANEKSVPSKTAAEKAPTTKAAPEQMATERPAPEKIAPAKIDPPAPAPAIEKPAATVATAPATAVPPAPPVATAPALPAALPRIGDTWEYRMRSKWATVKPRTYTHQVTAVSAREVAQTISVDTEATAGRQAFTPETRFVEWRGQGFYLLEFNPFLEAFGGLQSAAGTLTVPAMPADDPFHANWSSRGRIRGYESVSVPAGTFKALKVEIDSNRAPTEGPGNRSREPTRALLTFWYAPEVKRSVKMLRVVLTDEGMHLDEDTYELVKYRVQ